MAKPKIKGGTIVAKPYPILEECIERGIRAGWNRAHKHTDTPTEEGIFEQISHYINLEICERFDFKDE